MVRARMFRVALAAGLGLVSGCSTCQPGGFLWRVTHPFQARNGGAPVSAPAGGFAPCGPAPVFNGATADGPAFDGPVLGDPGIPALPPGVSGESAPPPLLAPPPRPLPPTEAQRMPYQG